MHDVAKVERNVFNVADLLTKPEEVGRGLDWGGDTHKY